MNFVHEKMPWHSHLWELIKIIQNSVFLVIGPFLAFVVKSAVIVVSNLTDIITLFKETEIDNRISGLQSIILVTKIQLDQFC